MNATTTDTKVIGRDDYHTRQTVTVVTIEGYEAWVDAAGRVLEPCWKCGTEETPGSIRAFAHVLGAVCFKCNGFGYTKIVGTVEEATKAAKRRETAAAKRAAKREAEAAAKMAEQDAKAAAWAAANADLAAALNTRYEAAHAAGTADGYYAYVGGLDSDETALTDLAETAHNRGLTEGQAKFAADLIARIAAKAAAADASVYIGSEGDKVTVTGTVVKAGTFESGYGFRTFTKAIVVVEDGKGGTAVAFTTAAWAFEVEEGQTITVTGTVSEHRERDGVRQTILNRPKQVK